MPIDNLGISAGFDASAYLNRVKGITPAASSATTAAPSVTAPSNTSSSNSSSGTASVNLPSDILSILQAADPNSGNGRLVSNLFDSSRIGSDSLSGLYKIALFNYSSTQTFTRAISTTQNVLANNATNDSPVQRVLTAYNAAQNSASALAQKNVREAVDAILGEGQSIIT